MKNDSAILTMNVGANNNNNNNNTNTDLNNNKPATSNDKMFFSGSSELSVANPAPSTYTHTNMANNSSQSNPGNSNRNIINHFFSQVNSKSFKSKTYKPIIRQEQPIIITPTVNMELNNNSNNTSNKLSSASPNVIIATNSLIYNTTSMTTPNMMQNRPNSTTQITIQELQLPGSKNNASMNNGSSRNLASKMNHVHFTSPLTLNPSLSNTTLISSSNQTTTGSILPPANSQMSPPNTSVSQNANANTTSINNNSNSNNNSNYNSNGTNVNVNSNGFHSASVSKLLTSNGMRMVANANTMSSNVPLKNISTIRSSSFRHKNLTMNSKLGRLYVLVFAFDLIKMNFRMTKIVQLVPRI